MFWYCSCVRLYSYWCCKARETSSRIEFPIDKESSHNKVITLWGFTDVSVNVRIFICFQMFFILFCFFRNENQNFAWFWFKKYKFLLKLKFIMKKSKWTNSHYWMFLKFVETYWLQVFKRKVHSQGFCRMSKVLHYTHSRKSLIKFWLTKRFLNNIRNGSQLSLEQLKVILQNNGYPPKLNQLRKMVDNRIKNIQVKRSWTYVHT